MLLMCFLPMAVSADFGDFDVMITSEEIEYSSHMDSIRLVDPTITLKHSSGKAVSETITAKKLSAFWDPHNKKGDYFGGVKPNANLTAWSKQGEVTQFDFVIKGARAEEGDIIFGIAPLEKHLKVFPMTASDVKSTTQQAKHITEQSEKGTITVTISCNRLGVNC